MNESVKAGRAGATVAIIVVALFDLMLLWLEPEYSGCLGRITTFLKGGE